MSVPLSFTRRLLDVIIPTRAQLLIAFLIALAILVAAQSRIILQHFGLEPDVVAASGYQFQLSLDTFLRSTLASQTALITFWATVGLVAYLVCWGSYNAFVEARNEVTLNTEYTNRGHHWRGPYQTLGLKAAAALALALLIASVPPALAVWVSLTAQAINLPSLSSTLLGLCSIVGFTLQLYALLAAVQLMFTPWYRPEAFTEV